MNRFVSSLRSHHWLPLLLVLQPGLNPEDYVSIPFLFQGQYYDHETGLAYNRFRYIAVRQKYFIEDTLHPFVRQQ